MDANFSRASDMFRAGIATVVFLVSFIMVVASTLQGVFFNGFGILKSLQKAPFGGSRWLLVDWLLLPSHHSFHIVLWFVFD